MYFIMCHEFCVKLRDNAIETINKLTQAYGVTP